MEMLESYQEQDYNPSPLSAYRPPTRNIYTFWNQERTEYLIQNWAGKSASQIANVLGCSRSAVIGRAWRLRMPSKGPSERTEIYGPFLPRPRRKSPRPRVRIMTEKYFVIKSQEVPATQPDNSPVGLLDLESHHCRYPVGHSDVDGLALFCGAPKWDGLEPYCAFHGRMCYNLEASRRGPNARLRLSSPPIRERA